MTSLINRLPTYYISHGGGPWLEGEFRRQFERLEVSLQDIRHEIGARPRCILMVSGHWEEQQFTVQSALRPRMIYDYGGFPSHTYHIRYQSPGAPVSKKESWSVRFTQS